MQRLNEFKELKELKVSLDAFNSEFGV